MSVATEETSFYHPDSPPKTNNPDGATGSEEKTAGNDNKLDGSGEVEKAMGAMTLGSPDVESRGQ